jgi:uncharacterized protein YndB with AHSA1/START domain
MTGEELSPLPKRSKGLSTPKKIILALMLTPLFLLLIGFALPSDYSVQRTVFIPADAEAIHESVVDLRVWPEWTPWNSQLDPTLVYTYEGEPGVGFRSRWTGEDAGKGTLEITSAEPGRGIVYVMKFEGYPPMDGVIDLQANKGGTTVTWKMSGKMNPPMGGWLSMMMDSALGADIEKAFAGLTKRFTP